LLYYESFKKSDTLFSGKICNDVSERKRHQREEEATRKEIEEIRSEFGAEYLDGDLRFAFARKAVQKLRDYADYANIANDTALDSVFRNQAESMLPDLFYAGIVPVFPDSGTNVIYVDSVKVLEPLRISAGSSYIGILTFDMKLMDVAGDNTIYRVIPGRMMEMIAVRQSHGIGEDTIKIWKVFLGK
jgi:hypothetical protein